jgi:ubiquinone/menaquinone biosynthesis C-methylase UbiE
MTTPTPPICNYENSAYQTDFWEHGGRVYEDQAEAIAIQRLLPKSGELLLELGAGAGRNTPRYSGYKRVVLLDYSLTQLQQARERLGVDQRYIYVAADIYRLPFVRGLFDSATMIRTLHHMAEPVLALRQVRRSLQPQAVFILEFANKHNIKAILRYLLRKQSWSPFSRESVEFEQLNFDFHPQAIRGWLADTDFSIKEQLAVSYFRLGIFKRYLPLSLLSTLETWLQPTGRWAQLSPSIFTKCIAINDSTVAQAGMFFKCPACESDQLELRDTMLLCTGCSREWPIIDGVYDFRVKTD